MFRSALSSCSLTHCCSVHVLGPIPALAFDPLEAFPSEALATFSECLGGRCCSQVTHNTSVGE